VIMHGLIYGIVRLKLGWEGLVGVSST